jgi:hypothetical protein
MTYEPQTNTGDGFPLDDDPTIVSAGAAPPSAPERRLSGFISYKHGEENGDVASKLHAKLSSDYDVFIDEQIPLGDDWAQRIEERLRGADFVLALISRDALDADNVIAEIKIAHTLYFEKGSPIIIPIRLWFSDQYGYKLGRLLDRFQDYYLEDSDNLPALIKPLQAAISKGKAAPLEAEYDGKLNGYKLKRFTAQYLAKSYVAIPELEQADLQLEEKNIVWITGDTGVRNFAARSLAAMCDLSDIYEIPKSQSWTQVNGTRVSNSVIIFRDTLPSNYFNEETAGKELAALSNLIARNNLVILTSPPDELSQARVLMRRWDFKKYYSAIVSHASYSTENKQQIFVKMLEVSREFGEVDPRSYRLGRSLLDRSAVTYDEAGRRGRSRREGNADDGDSVSHSHFHYVLEKWTPEDVERFVVNNLPEVKTKAELVKLLQQNATLDEEVRTWFISLDDSTKCFVLALAIFSELNNEQLWLRYKVIFEKLHHIDSRLSLWPLGVCRQRAAPYVTVNGSAEFVNDRVAEAIRLEVVRDYREYLLEFKPELKAKIFDLGAEAYATKEQGEERNRAVDTEHDRFLISRILGEAVKVEHKDLEDVLAKWAKDEDVRERELVAAAFEVAAADIPAAGRILDLLSDWCFGTFEADPGPNRVWASASALGRIACVTPGSPVSAQALAYLKRLAADRRDRVTDYVSVAVKRAARKLPVKSLRELMSLLAHHWKPYTRINVADALNEMLLADEEDGDAKHLFQEWLAADDTSLRRAAVCTLILQDGRRRSRGSNRAVDDIQQFMISDGATFVDALRETIADQHYQDNALTTLYRLALRYKYGDESDLVNVLGDSLSRQSDEEFLALLRRSGRPRLTGLLAEIRCAMWERYMNDAASLLHIIDEGMGRPDTAGEATKAFELLARPDPVGHKWQVIAALADCFTHDHGTLEHVLLRLKSSATGMMGDLALIVRHTALNELLSDPVRFVEYVYEDMRHPDRTPDTLYVLERLACPEPVGRQEDLAEALIRAYPQKPAEVNTIQAKLRAAGADPLLQLVQVVRPRLLGNLLASPLEFLAQVQKTRHNVEEWEETLDILEFLATPGRQGRRAMLISAFAQAMLVKTAEVEALLSQLPVSSRSHLDFFFRLRVKLEYHIKRLFNN